MNKVLHKLHVSAEIKGNFEFVMSDDTPDRVGDVINADGWDIKNFKKNPIALFNHKADQPIGRWKNVRVENDALVGTLELAPEGTSPRIDELRRLVEAGILRAVSVGFRPLKFSFMEEPSDGILFEEQELLECSLVSVPANPNAVQLLAKSLHLSDETVNLVFGKFADKDDPAVRRSLGESAAKPKPKVTQPMKTLAARIQDAEAKLTSLRDQLADHVKSYDDEPSDEQVQATEELNSQIDAAKKNLDSLKSVEKALGESAADDTQTRSPTDPGQRRPFAAPKAKEPAPKDLVIRSVVATVLSKIEQRDKLSILRERYGDHPGTRAVFEAVTKAAVSPATTTTAGWAAELVETAVLDFIDTLMPQSVYPGLSARGGRFTFGRNGVVSLPSRSSTPTIAGSFVGQGSPIPVRKGTFAATTLTPKKMGVISTFTREIAEHSTPNIEAMIRQAIQEDTAVAIDTVLLDNNAATAIRPAGVRSGVTVTGATAGGGFNALVTDIKNLVNALVTATNGNIRQPVWIMNPIQALAISLTANAGGDFPFKQEIAGGNFQGYPLLQSTSVTAGMVILMDAADFFSATGDDPRFDVSDQAVIHEEDTTPLAIGTAGSPNTVAAPTRSLWQTDTIGIRMMLDINWALRRTGVVAWTQSVTW